MTDCERLYMRRYMRAYRAAGRDKLARIRLVVRKGAHHPPRVFLPLIEQRHGHCAWCGLRSRDTTCGFCQAELEGRPLPRAA